MVHTSRLDANGLSEHGEGAECQWFVARTEGLILLVMGIEDDVRRKIERDQQRRRAIADAARPRATAETLEFVQLAKRHKFRKYKAATVSARESRTLFGRTRFKHVQSPTGYSVYVVRYFDALNIAYLWAIRESDGVAMNCQSPDVNGEVVVEPQLDVMFNSGINEALTGAAARHFSS